MGILFVNPVFMKYLASFIYMFAIFSEKACVVELNAEVES
jgi:hypothetical protein